jgi:hypothetical protein
MKQYKLRPSKLLIPERFVHSHAANKVTKLRTTKKNKLLVKKTISKRADKSPIAVKTLCASMIYPYASTCSLSIP